MVKPKVLLIFQQQKLYTTVKIYKHKTASYDQCQELSKLSASFHHQDKTCRIILFSDNPTYSVSSSLANEVRLLICAVAISVASCLHIVWQQARLKLNNNKLFWISTFLLNLKGHIHIKNSVRLNLLQEQFTWKYSKAN
jgi:hypothetical protein